MKDELGDRIKTNYESITKYLLPRRTYVTIRLDGKAFHTFTKGLEKPFDKGLCDDMDNTALFLCNNIGGCKLAYVQSDEITLVLTDFEEDGTQPWFGNELQKICSISASMATSEFNKLRLLRTLKEEFKSCEDIIYDLELSKQANFDSRVFSISSRFETINHLIWRQRDATRNSMSMAAQSVYSHKELEKVSSSKKQELLFQKGINWNDYPVRYKRGGFVMKVPSLVQISKEQADKIKSSNDENQIENLCWYSSRLLGTEESFSDYGYFYIKRKKFSLVECPHFTVEEFTEGELQFVLPILK